MIKSNFNSLFFFFFLLQRVHMWKSAYTVFGLFKKNNNNYQALTNEKDIHLKIKATKGKLCYPDLANLVQ